MLMAREYLPDRRVGFPVRACPEDFAEMLVRIGRLACEEHYHVGRSTVDRWLDQSGKDDLLERRRAFVRELNLFNRGRMRACPPDFDLAFVHLGRAACERRYKASNRLIDRWLGERGKERLLAARERHIGGGGSLSRRNMGAILRRAFPVTRT